MDDREDGATDEFGWPWWWEGLVEFVGALTGLFFVLVLIVGTIRAIGLFWRPFG